MRKITLLAILILSIYTCAGQEKEKLFILSFPYEFKDTLIEAPILMFKKNPMTDEEALQFVYNNDTSRLYCKGVYFDQIEEKETGQWCEKKLPNKCLGINADSFYIVAYTSYDCQDPKAQHWDYLHFVIYDKNFHLKDDLLLYQGDEYDYKITGLLNVKSIKFLRYYYDDYFKERVFQIIRVNRKTLKFETIKELRSKASISTDDMINAMESLKLNEYLN